MTRSKNITILITLLLVVALLSANMFTFAYFYYESKILDSGNIVTTPDDKNNDPNVQSVSTYKELLYATSNDTHNGSNMASTTRGTVMLTRDIKLSNHLYITADVNIDLNGKAIDTRGYNINIEHYYVGQFAIYNGTIMSTMAESSVVVKTPRASIRLDNIQYDNVTARVLSYDAAMLIEDCYDLISRSLEGQMSSRLFYNASGNQHAPRNRACIYHDNASSNNNCNNIYSDIDLPIGYYGYGVSIKYTSSDSTALSPNGSIGSVAGRVDVLLTATISQGGESVVRDYNLHIINSGNSESARAAATVDMVEYMERYYYEGVLDGGTQVVQVYNITDSTILPRYHVATDSEYVYTTYAADGSVVDSTDNIKGISFALDKNNAQSDYVLTVDKNVDNFTIGVRGSDSTATLKASGSQVSVVQDNYTRALAITRDLYGAEIVVSPDKAGYMGFTSQPLYNNMTEYERGDKISVNYSLSYDMDRTYAIGDINDTPSIRVVNSNNPPTEIQRVSLKAKFTFDNGGNAEVVTITVPIRYDSLDMGDGNTLPRFWAYYRYYDRLLTLETGGYTYSSFTMPFGYEYGEPIFYYDVIGDNGVVNDKIITQTLVYVIDGTTYRRTLQEVMSMSGEMIDTIHRSANAQWQYTINIASVPLTDSDLSLRYRYKFMDYSGNWQGDGAQGSPIFESKLIVPGLIKDRDMGSGVADYIIDTNLYAYVYNNSNPSAVADKYVANSGMYIIYSWLDREFINAEGKSEIDNSSRKLGIQKYNGLQLLKNVRKLNLSAAVADIAVDAPFIAGMTGLVELDLSNNGQNVYDRKSSSIGFPSGANSYFLRTLSATLVNLEVLHIEKNSIYYFNNLTDFPNLKEVYVYGSAFTKGSWAAINNIISSLYGATGIISRSVFNRLLRRDVQIYNEEGKPPYKISGETNVVVNSLNNIVYQDRLPYGVNISEVYSGLSTTPGDYVEKQSASGNDTLAFKTAGADGITATEFYAEFTYKAITFLWFTTDIVIEVYYQIIRY